MAKKKPDAARLIRCLPCHLAPAEMLVKGRELADRNSDLERSEDRKKEIGKTLSAEVEAAKTRVRSVSQVVTQGYEYRDVECEVEYDRENRVARVVRLDTAEEVERRPMTDEELQQRLEMES